MHRAEQKKKVSVTKSDLGCISHPADLRFALVLVEGGGAQVAPPLEQH